MLDKLKKQFPSLLVQDQINLDHNFKHYKTDHGHYVSIHKDELSEHTQELLSIFLTPISINNTLSPERNFWTNSLLSKNTDATISLQHFYDHLSKFRLIHFHIQAIVEQGPFEEAVSSLSISTPLVIWITEQSGVIIEQIKQEKITLDELIDLQNAITTDFYTDVHFYVGDTFTLEDSIFEQYQWESNCFELSKGALKNRNIYQYYDILPIILLNEASAKSKARLVKILRDVPESELESIKVFIENGLNVSLAAKKLFMHRNSLQYRVEKFIEKTGVDIKSFEGALVIYIAILSLNL